MLDAVRPGSRAFLPEDFDAAALADLSAAYDELATRPLTDTAALERWLADWSELEKVLDEAQTRREIAMARRTDDAAAHAAYLDGIDRVAPHCEPRRDRLARRLVAHPQAHALEPSRHACLRRGLAGQVALFTPAGVALAAEEQRLCAEYRRLRAATTVAWDGAARPVAVVEAEAESADRGRREAAWRAVSGRFAADREAYDELFDRLLAVRRTQATAAGLADYRDYRLRRLGRFDYGPEDCRELHAAIEAEVVPLAGELAARRAGALGVATVRPWDLAAPLGGPLLPLPGGADEAALVAGCTRVFAAVDPAFAAQFAGLARDGLLDLMARPNKAPGAFEAALAECGAPFLFADAVGRHEDLLTVLHEGGHAFHAIACAADPLIWNRRPPLEFCELAGTAMELLGARHFDVFYPPAALRRALALQLEQVALFLPFMACVDAFQHWLYTRPEAPDAAARAGMWSALHRRFAPEVDWRGLEGERAALWHRQAHVFERPFYFVEYGVAQLGALQLLERYLEAPAAAVADYRRGLALGARAGLRELFAASGLRLDLSRAGVRRAMTFVRAELARLG